MLTFRHLVPGPNIWSKSVIYERIFRHGVGHSRETRSTYARWTE